MTQTTSYAREAARAMAAELEETMKTNIGRLQSLEQFDELPLEQRGEFLQALSGFRGKRIASFFQMIQEEYGQECRADVARAMKKLQMAGVKVEETPWFEGTFHAAWCTPTRHMGALSISLFWEISEGWYTAECFLLNFGTDGISNFVLAEHISEQDMEVEKQSMQELKSLTLRECQILLTRAYAVNRKMLVRPAMGKFLYGRHLLPEGSFSEREVRLATLKVSALLYGERLMNSFFLGLKSGDMDYCRSVFAKETDAPQALRPFAAVQRPGTLFLQGCADAVYPGLRDQVWVDGHILVYAEQKVWRYPYAFRLVFHSEEVRWKIEEIREFPVTEEAFENEENPLRHSLYVRVYQIWDMETLLHEIDELEQVQKVGELPYGLHLRICTVDDTFFENGVSLMSGVVADLLINGEEFVVLADQESIPGEFDRQLESCVQFKADYRVSLNTAIHYFQGQYQYFEDILDVPEDAFPQDPMRFVTACYILSEPQRLQTFLESRNIVQFALPDERVLYYQFAEKEREASFEAEYIVEDTYLAVSAFGDAQLERVRRELENALQEGLHFEHLEVNPHGFFEIVTPDVKESLPELPGIMQKIYLEKWKVSACPFLQGMTPQEAYESEEGKRLLWKMFKWMCTRPNWFSAGRYADIAIQTFMDCLEEDFFKKMLDKN